MDTPETFEKRSLYQVIIDDLKKQIQNNAFSFEKPICTEKSLTERYHVSRITAKRAISELEGQGVLYRIRGRGSFVSRDIYSETSRDKREKNTFAFVVPFDITKGCFIQTFQAANAVLNSAGYGTSIYISDDIAISRGRAILSRLLEEDISGLVYYPITDNIHLDVLNRYALQDKPVVIMDIGTHCPYLHSVTTDNYGAERELIESLIALGHRKIAYLSGFAPETRVTIRDRFGGYLNAMKRHGLSVSEDQIITDLGINYRVPEESGNPRSTPLCKALLRLRAAGVTAIATENDELGFYTVMACQELGFRVPEEISVCGFDHSDLANMLSGGLTTAAQDFKGIGREIARLLLESIGEPTKEGCRVVVPARLVTQGSTAPPGGRHG